MLLKTDATSDSQVAKQNKRTPHNIKVKKKQSPVANVSSYPSIDEVFKEKYDNPFPQDSASKKTPDLNTHEHSTTPIIERRSAQPRTSTSHIRSLRKKVTKTASKGSPVKKVTKKLRAVRAAYMICIACGPLYLMQLMFWFVALIGFAIMAGAVSMGEIYGGNIITRTVVNSVAYIYSVGGESVFVAGWIISSILGLTQLFTALGIFYANRVNALAGDGLQNFGFWFAIYALPLGIVPWGIFWILGVIKK